MSKSTLKNNLPKLEEVPSKIVVESANATYLPQAFKSSVPLPLALAPSNSENETVSGKEASEISNNKYTFQIDTGSNMANNSNTELSANDLTLQISNKPIRGLNNNNNNEQESLEGPKSNNENNSNNIPINNALNEDQGKMIESLKQMFLNFKPNVNLKNEDLERLKQIEELNLRFDYLERERKTHSKSFNLIETNYLERIKNLEAQLISTDKVDATLLNKQNKDYENQISHFNKITNSMNNKHGEEKHKFNKEVADVLVLKEKLMEEIKSLEKIKKDVMNYENENENEEKRKPKMELVIRTNDSMDMLDLSLEGGVLPLRSKNVDSVENETNTQREFIRVNTTEKTKMPLDINSENN